jgi:hypothetical protein
MKLIIICLAASDRVTKGVATDQKSGHGGGHYLRSVQCACTYFDVADLVTAKANTSSRPQIVRGTYADIFFLRSPGVT